MCVCLCVHVFTWCSLLPPQERQLAESAKAELAKAAQKKDLRNKLNKRKLVVMNVAKEDHLKLAQLFEVCLLTYISKYCMLLYP